MSVVIIDDAALNQLETEFYFCEKSKCPSTFSEDEARFSTQDSITESLFYFAGKEVELHARACVSPRSMAKDPTKPCTDMQVESYTVPQAAADTSEEDKTLAAEKGLSKPNNPTKSCNGKYNPCFGPLLTRCIVCNAV